LGHGTIIEALTNVPAHKKRVILLKLEGLDYKTTPLVLYDIYLNLPEGVTPGRTSPHYVGLLRLFGVKHEMTGGMHHTHSNIFDVSRFVNNPDMTTTDVSLTFVPVPLLIPVEGRELGSAVLAPEPGVIAAAVKVLAVESAF
jgi:hypothetical protein